MSDCKHVWEANTMYCIICDEISGKTSMSDLWISVQDELPKHGEECFVRWLDEEDRERFEWGARDINGLWIDAYAVDFDEPVTHWMKIEGPK